MALPTCLAQSPSHPGGAGDSQTSDPHKRGQGKGQRGVTEVKPGHRALSLEGGLTLNSLPLDEASYLDIPIKTSELDPRHPDRSLTFVVLFYAAGGVLLA